MGDTPGQLYRSIKWNPRYSTTSVIDIPIEKIGDVPPRPDGDRAHGAATMAGLDLQTLANISNEKSSTIAFPLPLDLIAPLLRAPK